MLNPILKRLVVVPVVARLRELSLSIATLRHRALTFVIREAAVAVLLVLLSAHRTFPGVTWLRSLVNKEVLSLQLLAFSLLKLLSHLNLLLGGTSLHRE